MSPRHETIATLAPRLASGELSAEALLDECFAAIALHDDELRSMLALDPRARAEARACDAEARAGRVRGPLHGVPVAVKDNIDVEGLPTTSGCRGLAGAMPFRDAGQVARLRAAGAVILGKTNLSEFSFEIRSRSSLGGDVRNPFARHATAGGSSGGTAVAVAAGFAVAGLGSDTGGSIRVPAAYTGLVGLRPTHGLLDARGVAPLAPSTDTVAPMTRSVADATLLFRLMGGMAEERPVEGLRVGVLRQAFGSHREIAAAAERVCAILSAAGAGIVDPVALPETLLPVGGPHIVDAEFADAFDVYLATNFHPGTAPQGLDAILAGGAYLPDHRDDLRRRLARRGEGRAAILAHHAALREALDALMAEHCLDALLHPTSMVLPETLDNPKGGWAPDLAACSGWPALSLPAGRSSDGLPIGVELIGRAGAEGLLLCLGTAIERGVGPRCLPPQMQ
jgi:Asp-tRNA(Asn)/Glu-tRNA(Gln) amidotransferase A subunit family amidase